MALQMVDDPQDEQEDYQEDIGGGQLPGSSGGGGGLFGLLPLLGMFRGKNLLIVLLIAAAGYFLLNRGGCNNASTTQSNFSESGYNFDPNEFSKASVYEGLEDNNSKNPLPEAVSLARFAPQRLNQGKQGSCVAWSCAYAARTILESSSSLSDPNQNAYSPAFVYNNIALDDCQGSYILRAMQFMQQRGAVPFEDFKYDETDCSRQAGTALLQKASQNKIHGFNRLTETDDVNGISIRSIKEHLAKDAPVVIGMMAGGSFLQQMAGQRVWHPTAMDRQQIGFGGHAMCVIGYDDRVEGGAFQLMNSWGPEWGQNGLAYVRYADFKEFVREAYGLDPLPKKGAALTAAFECQVALIDNESKQSIALKPVSGHVYRTVTPIRKGSRFKLELKNAVECYTYIFTPDNSGKSFVLFPYKPIHSAYFGITGYRLFPRKESIRADENGNRDFMGLIVSRTPLDYQAINNSINSNSGGSFSEKMNAVIAPMQNNSVQFSTGLNQGVYFKASQHDNTKIVACIVEIDKQ